ncbi:MAG: Ig-like domain-containing protein [Paludibacteraceae bacterium]|nr:Ig-like domain-containing protein [Paludibacteraceae bacterium]
MKALSTYRRLTVLIVISLLVASCANRGAGPQGGPKDEIPPVLEKCSPEPGSVNVDTLLKSVKMEFDENTAIKDAHKYVVVSPPMKNKPMVRATNKKVYTSFEDDTLQANTTYTIDYGNAITDNNEGNPLVGLSYTFSTGDHLDTLFIDGYVIDAHTLAPKPEIIVGVYPNATDSDFITKPLFRVAKTNEEGYFRIKNIPDSTYRIYAINDLSSNWYYKSAAGGEVAFLDEPLKPQTSELQNSLTLKLFKEELTQEYFKKAFRPARETFTIVFGHEPTMMPDLKVLGTVDSVNSLNTELWVLEKPIRKDSLVYWITDTTLLKTDTLRLEMKYLKTDSLGKLAETLDTLKLTVPIKRSVQAKKKKKDEEHKSEIQFIAFTHNIQQEMEVYDTITINFAEPIKSILYDSITVSIKVDSLFNPIPISFETGDSACNKELRILYEKQFDQTYRLNIDSACITSIYGRHNNKFYKTFTYKKPESYANLYITFVNNPENAILELMNEQEAVKYTSILEDNEVIFQDIAPGTYYLRMIIDDNHNGKWDTGNVMKGLQPEKVYYMPEKLDLPANWDIEQKWDYESFDFMSQRPSELKPAKSK